MIKKIEEYQPGDFNCIINGDVFNAIKKIPSESIDCIITSPPYWSLRSYLPQEHTNKIFEIGQEYTFEEYLKNLWLLCEELKRVLKPTGTMFWNIGDTYSGSGCGCRYSPDKAKEYADAFPNKIKQQNIKNIRHKSMIGIPMRFAIGMIDRGWILRNDIIWRKPNAKPESANDRFTRVYEDIFFFVKEEKYYFNLDAVREPLVESTLKRIQYPLQKFGTGKNGACFNKDTKSCDTKILSKSKFLNHTKLITGSPRERQILQNKHFADFINIKGKNPGNVWNISTEALTEHHYASYPTKLVERCILSGCHEKGIILDPFLGSGTTGLVSLKLGRKFLGIEINEEYCKIAESRITKESGLFLNIK